MLVAMAVSYIGNQLLASQQKLPDFTRERQHVLRSASQARQVVYGRAMVSGPLAFASVTKKTPGLKKGEYLHLVIPIAGHEIDAVEEVYFDDKPVSEYDKFGTEHTVRIGFPAHDGYGTMRPLAPNALVSLTLDGVTYDNTGSRVQAKLEAAGYEVWHDHWTYIRAPSVGTRFTVSAVSASDMQWVDDGMGGGSWQPVVVAARAEVFKDGDSIYFWRAHLGTSTQIADPDLVAQVEEWTNAHRLRGIAYLYVRLRWKADAWKTGIPNIKAIVRGKKVFDPRTGTTAWSENAALCALDWVRYQHGIGAPDDEIDMPSWIAAANVCDEDEVTPTGTQKRYTAGGVITLDMSPVQALEQLTSAMAGRAFDFMGKWYGYAGADIPATVTLTEDDLRGPIRVRPRPSRQQLYNAVRGTYVDPEQHWAATEFPPVVNAMYQEEDGGEQIFSDIELPFTTEPVRAQRIGKIALERARQGITVEFPGKLSCLRVRPWVPIRLSIDRLGWEEKLFVVKDWKLSEDFGVDLTLQEYAPGVWDWASGSATTVDLAPNTELGDPFDVDAPANVVLSSGAADLLVAGDGTLQSRIRVAWGESEDAFVSSGGRTEVEYRRSDEEGAWKSVPPVTGVDREAFIAPVIDGALYDVRVRHVNALGVPGEWATFSRYQVEGKMAEPADVHTFGAEIRDRQIYLYWSAVPDLDVSEYEIRRGGSDWYDAEFVCRVAGTDTYREAQAGASTWRIKAVDTSGNPSENDAVTTLTINPPVVTSLTAEVIDNNVLLRHTSTAGTLPIASYEIRRGAAWETAVVIGTDVASFTPLFETVAGDYTYWVAAVDIAGNYGTPKSVGAHVMQPPDYVLNAHLIDDLSGSMTNMIAEAGQLVGNIDTSETWAEHFTSNSWASPQDQIAAGYPLYMEPALSSAQYVRTFDYGTQLGGSMITVILAPQVLSGAPAFACTIEVSPDNSTWTTYAGVWQVYASSFRYVRITLDVTGAGVYRLNPVEVRLDAKRKTDGGMGTANAADASGTEVLFSETFVDVGSITVTPAAGSGAAYGLYDFTDTPYPTGFKVFLYDKNGARVSGGFSWTARGF